MFSSLNNSVQVMHNHRQQREIAARRRLSGGGGGDTSDCDDEEKMECCATRTTRPSRTTAEPHSFVSNCLGALHLRWRQPQSPSLLVTALLCTYLMLSSLPTVAFAGRQQDGKCTQSFNVRDLGAVWSCIRAAAMQIKGTANWNEMHCNETERVTLQKFTVECYPRKLNAAMSARWNYLSPPPLRVLYIHAVCTRWRDVCSFFRAQFPTASAAAVSTHWLQWSLVQLCCGCSPYAMLFVQGRKI